MGESFKPQAWHVETRGMPEPVVIAAFATRGVAEEYRDSYNAEWSGPFGEFDLNLPEHLADRAYVCLCDCPDRACKWLIEVSL